MTKTKSARKPVNTKLSSTFLRAGDERIELPPKVLETPIIPFDQSPICNFCYCCNYTYKSYICQAFICTIAKITVHYVHSNTLRDAGKMNLLAQSPRSIVCSANLIYANRINSRRMSRDFGIFMPKHLAG